jgi:hypothetical protein
MANTLHPLVRLTNTSYLLGALMVAAITAMFLFPSTPQPEALSASHRPAVDAATKVAKATVHHPAIAVPPVTPPATATPVPTTPPPPAAPPTTAPPPPATPAVTARATTPTATTPTATPGYGCAAALSYLQSHAAPGFTFECPGSAEGRQAMTCVNVAGVCSGTRLIAISVPCPAAYMNEASNSWVVIGESHAALDPYGYCH